VEKPAEQVGGMRGDDRLLPRLEPDRPLVLAAAAATAESVYMRTILSWTADMVPRVGFEPTLDGV
jgi:hypothetical protein